MDLQLAGARVLVTGGSRGIGQATALAFAQEGALPVLAARDAGQLEQARDAIAQATGIVPETASVDLGQRGAARRLADQVGDVDILVNNAGSIPRGTLADLDDEHWRQAWELKLYGYIDLMRHYLPRMEAGRAGVIANIIGMGGVANRYSYACGSAANAALIALTNAAGGASTRHGVRVFGINPPATLTERLRALHGTPEKLAAAEQGMPFGRFGTVDEVAYMVVCTCSPRAGYLSGTVINLDGGRQYAEGG